jgi:uncharacterized membrane protein YebE (DUF533 family)
MFDARQLLDQVMGAQPADGGKAPAAGNVGSTQLLTGALAGGVLGLLVGNKRARKLARKSAGSALKLGGLAAVAAIGYTAWQRSRGGAGSGLHLPPPDSGFALAHETQGQDNLARGILVAMIQGAKADGHVDAEEQARIFRQVDALSLDESAKAFMMDELAAPPDVARIAAYASTPEIATELYAAAFLAMDPDTTAERMFLAALQAALRLDAGLARHIEEAVQAEALA